jgi:hypothetical protein
MAERFKRPANIEDGPVWWRSAGVPACRDQARRAARKEGWLPRHDISKPGWEFWEEPDGTIRFLTLNGFWGYQRNARVSDIAHGQH